MMENVYSIPYVKTQPECAVICQAANMSVSSVRFDMCVCMESMDDLVASNIDNCNNYQNVYNETQNLYAHVNRISDEVSY